MQIIEHVSLAPFTTFKIGGSARYFLTADSIEGIQQGALFAKKNSLPIFLLGGGSNVLIGDDGFSGLVIKNNIKGIEYSNTPNPESVLVIVGSGENWDEFVVDVVKKGFGGIENLSGIPGTTGAAPIQNIGAYGMEVKDVIEQVRTVDLRDGSVRIFTNAECRFDYRDSFFKTKEGGSFCVTGVTFKLLRNFRPNLVYKDLKEHFSNNLNPTLAEIRDAVLSIRSRKFPNLKTHGTAGSFWKNPIISRKKYEELRSKWPNIPGFKTQDSRYYKTPLAWILDNILGLKGYSTGGVSLFEKQPIVIVALKGTKKKDVEELACEVEKKIFETTGIEVEREVRSV